jgi:hypothetical protein
MIVLAVKGLDDLGRDWRVAEQVRLGRLSGRNSETGRWSGTWEWVCWPSGDMSRRVRGPTRAEAHVYLPPSARTGMSSMDSQHYSNLADQDCGATCVRTTGPTSRTRSRRHTCMRSGRSRPASTVSPKPSNSTAASGPAPTSAEPQPSATRLHRARPNRPYPPRRRSRDRAAGPATAAVAQRFGTDALFIALTAGQVHVHGLDGPACAIRTRQPDPGHLSRRLAESRYSNCPVFGPGPPGSSGQCDGECWP